MDKKEAKDLANQILNKNNPELRKTMTVPQMRRMLGIGKTESYWLVHRKFFKTREYNGHLYIDVDSFEEWYANQVKHKKVNGEEPGKRLKAKSYSFFEAATLLGCYEQDLYQIWQAENLPYITVDYVKRIPIDIFEEWYQGQDKFKKLDRPHSKDDVITNYIKLADAAKQLGISNEMMSRLSRREEYADYFKPIVFENRKWFLKMGFLKFLRAQNEFQIIEQEDSNEVDEDSIDNTVEMVNKEIEIPAPPLKYLTKQEAADLSGLSVSTITRYMQNGKLPYKGRGYTMRIEKSVFDRWLENYMAKENNNGNDQTKE